MTKRGKYGDRPGRPDEEMDVATRASHPPLPLGTQPMAAMRPGLAHTVPVPADVARAALDNARPTVAMQAPVREPLPVSRDAPEIGLTQHHHPEDSDPDPRLILHLDPDSERAAHFRVLRHHLLE